MSIFLFWFNSFLFFYAPHSMFLEQPSLNHHYECNSDRVSRHCDCVRILSFGWICLSWIQGLLFWIYYICDQLLLHLWPLLRLWPIVITLVTFITFVTNCYYTCDLYYICDLLLHLCVQQGVSLCCSFCRFELTTTNHKEARRNSISVGYIGGDQWA